MRIDEAEHLKEQLPPVRNDSLCDLLQIIHILPIEKHWLSTRYYEHAIVNAVCPQNL